MLAPLIDPLTVEQFLTIYAGAEGKYELVDGQVYAMSGGSRRHADVAGNVYVALRNHLRTDGCRPFNSDMGVRIDARTLRYPDVTVSCDPRDLDADPLETLELNHPRIICEVLSPSTSATDRGRKVWEYKSLDSLVAIILLDPVTRRMETHERRGPDEWLHRLHPSGANLAIADPAITLTHAEIFDA